MKYFKLLLIFTFWFILIIPMFLINTKTEQVSLLDNTKLPEVESICDFSSFENYISKRIGFRTNIITTYTEINDKLFNKMIHPTYTYGTNDYVFFKIRAEYHDDFYLNKFAQLIKNIQTYVENRGSYFLFFINPTKISTYVNYLPNGYNYANYRVDYLKKKFEELNINYIDNTNILKEKAKKEQVFNKQYDAGHWNDLGAFYGINNVYDKLINDGLNINRLNRDNYTLNYETMTSLPVSEFKINEEIPKLSLIENNFVMTNNYNNFIKLNENTSYYLESKNNNVNNNYTVLFFRDSYMNSREKFVANVFSKVYYVHSYHNAVNVDYYYNITKPDIVLMDAVEYAITESLYSANNISNKIYNKTYNTYKNLEKEIFTELETKEINKQITENYENNIKLTTIKIDKNNFKYAYLRINKNEIYDFVYENDIAYIDLDTILLNESKSIELILINNKETKKQIIKII